MYRPAPAASCWSSPCQLIPKSQSFLEHERLGCNEEASWHFILYALYIPPLPVSHRSHTPSISHQLKLKTESARLPPFGWSSSLLFTDVVGEQFTPCFIRNRDPVSFYYASGKIALLVCSNTNCMCTLRPAFPLP